MTSLFNFIISDLSSIAGNRNPRQTMSVDLLGPDSCHIAIILVYGERWRILIVISLKLLAFGFI